VNRLLIVVLWLAYAALALGLAVVSLRIPG